MGTVPPTARLVKFGVFELDLRAEELRKSGLKLKFTGQPFQVLALLMERPGDIVTRDELQRRLWPDGTFVDFDHNLNAAINKIREVLGDSAENPRFVETLPRRGYRFIYPVAEGLPLASPAMSASPPPPRARASWAIAAVCALAAIVLAAVSLHFAAQPPKNTTARVVERLSVVPLMGDSLGPVGRLTAVAISPDGATIVFGGRKGTSTRLYLRTMDRLESTVVPGTEEAADPFFSPDSQWLGFFADGKLKKISLRGREPVTLCEATSGRGATWGPDGSILFAPTFLSGLMLVPAAGGTPRPFSIVDASKGERSHRWPQILPGGQAVVFMIVEEKDVGSLLESKLRWNGWTPAKEQFCLLSGVITRYSGSGHLLFMHEGGLFAAPFDLKRLKVTGQPSPVLDDVAILASFGCAHYALSEIGSLAYLPSTFSAEGLLTWVDRHNHIQALAAPARAYFGPRVSPDGHRVAVAIASGVHSDVWVYDIARGTLTRITFDGLSHSPVWTPDGKRITFTRVRAGKVEVVSKPPDGSGTEESVLGAQDFGQFPGSWSPDGKFLVYSTARPETGRDIFVLSLDGEHTSRPFVETKFVESGPMFSPDGDRIAYMSNESGRMEVYVQSFPGPGGKWQVSTQGGIWPVWAPNGRELFYLAANGNSVMSVRFTNQPNFSTSAPRFVADVPPLLELRLGTTYDVSPDGQRFLFVKEKEENAPFAEVRIILNWAEELKRLAPTGKQP